MRSQLHLELTEVHIARGELSGAARAADRALDFAEQSGDRVGAAQALRLTARTRRETGDAATAGGLLDRAEALLERTSGPELMRIYLERGRLVREDDPACARELVMRARGQLDALEARGAVLSERAEIEEFLAGPARAR